MNTATENQEQIIARITHVTQKEGQDWITVPKEYTYNVLVGKYLNKEMLCKNLGMQTIAALKTESGHVYDFILNSWRHLYTAATSAVKGEDKLMQNSAGICREEAAAIEKILAERGSRYGSFSGHAALTMHLKFMMEDHLNWVKLNASQREALHMIAHKIGRIINGDPNYMDSWADIAGYAQLIVNQLNGKDT